MDFQARVLVSVTGISISLLDIDVEEGFKILQFLEIRLASNPFL